jgi:shikimate kinase
MAGVGKSVLGKELAKRLRYEFVDVDCLIEERLGLTLQQIIDRWGEDRFLEIEQEAVLGLNGAERTIISPGGSVIYSPRAMKFLKGHSKVVFLNAPIESIERRIPNQSTRGIIGIKGKKLKELFYERAALYQKYADVTIDIPDAFDQNSILADIIQKLKLSQNPPG